jgi:hypothetical protein
MINFAKPVASDAYDSGVLQTIRDNQNALAAGLDMATPAGIQVGAIRWSQNSRRHEKWGGTSWQALVDISLSAYSINVERVGGRVPGNDSGQLPISNGVMNINLNSEMLGGKLIGWFASIAYVTSQMVNLVRSLGAQAIQGSLDIVSAGRGATYQGAPLVVTSIQNEPYPARLAFQTQFHAAQIGVAGASNRIASINAAGTGLGDFAAAKYYIGGDVMFQSLEGAWGSCTMPKMTNGWSGFHFPQPVGSVYWLANATGAGWHDGTGFQVYWVKLGVAGSEARLVSGLVPSNKVEKIVSSEAPNLAAGWAAANGYPDGYEWLVV